MLPLYVTSGEPAGIGPDICLSLAARIDERPIVVLADMAMLKKRAEILEKLNNESDYEKISVFSAELEKISDRMDELEMRWLELQE